MEIFESPGFLDLGAAMQSLNLQTTTSVKIYMQEMFEFRFFLKQAMFGCDTGLSLCLVPGFGNFGKSWVFRLRGCNAFFNCPNDD